MSLLSTLRSGVLVAAVIGGIGAALTTVDTAHADDRTPVDLPESIRDAFLADMRKHLANLDDILTAVADGDFTAAAEIAELRMDFGHRMAERLAEAGMSNAQIREVMEPMRKQRMQSGTGGMGMGMGMGGGMGRFMPEDFRALGQGFHQAARDFAATARAVGDPPTAEDYAEVLTALNGVTIACRGCHDAFRVR